MAVTWKKLAFHEDITAIPQTGVLLYPTASCPSGYTLVTTDAELDYMEYATDVLIQAAYPTNGHHAVTFNVTAQLDTAVKKWGTASLLLDGDSDFLSIPDSADWDILGSNSDDWTIDFPVKHTNHVGVDPYIVQYEDDNNRWLIFHIHGSGIRFVAASGGGMICDTGYVGEIADTNWHHIALCKVGNKYGLYKDGTQIGYVLDNNIDTFAGSLYIGYDAYSTPSYFDGHIDEPRIIHSNIFNAAPADAFGNGETPDTIVVPTAAHQTDTNTKLLLHLDGADEAVATLDYSRLDCYSEDTIFEQGTYSLKGFADGTDSLNDTLTRTVDPTIDLSGINTLYFYIYSSRTGSNIKIGIHDSGGTTTETTPNVTSAGAWQLVTWDISGVANGNKDVIDQIIITIVEAGADNTFYLDDFKYLTASTINSYYLCQKD